MKVSVWLEQLHDRRVEATRTQDLVVQKLNRKIKSLDAALLIDEYGKMIQSIRDNINNINDVGQNIEECREQIASLSTFERKLMEVSEKCLKLVATCEALDNNLYGDVSMECTLHAYDSLQVCTDLQQIVEAKTEIINSTIILMEDFSFCMEKLNAIEDESKRKRGGESKEAVKTIVNSFSRKAKTLLDKSLELKNTVVR